MLLIILQYEASLTGGSFDEGNMVKNIEACDWLTSAIKNLEASNIDPIYVKLRAVGPLSLGTTSISFPIEGLHA
jgi:hypothetical protein